MNPYRLILSLLLASFLSVTGTVDMRGQSIVYQADYSGSDFSAFGPNGGTIGVRFASQNVGSSGLPAEFYIAYDFSGWDQQNFSYVGDSSFGELSIRVAETYSGTIADRNAGVLRARIIFMDASQAATSCHDSTRMIRPLPTNYSLWYMTNCANWLRQRWPRNRPASTPSTLTLAPTCTPWV